MGSRIVAVAVALLAVGCAARVPMNKGVAEPQGFDFLEFPHKYQGRVVRLLRMQAARVTIARPMVFTPPGEPQNELVVIDGRSLGHTRTLVPDEVVTVVFECTEGRTDRGNLLLAIERPFEQAPAQGE